MRHRTRKGHVQQNKRSVATHQPKIIFGIGNYIENVAVEEQQRITKIDFVYIITDKYNNTRLHVETYSLTNKNGTSHIHVYWKQYMIVCVRN